MFGSSLIIGAFIFTPGCTKNTDDDDDLIGNWKRSNDFEGLARSEAVSFTIGSNAYVTTGATTTTRFKDLWQYSATNQYWTQLSDFPGSARNAAVAFSVNGKGYVGTGYDGINALDDFYEFDPAATTQWKPIASIPGGLTAGAPRYKGVAFAIDGKGYVACGYNGNYLNNMWQYDPGSNQWEKKASVGGSKRDGAFAFVFGNKAYVCAGNNNGTIQTDVQMYDPATDKWTEKTKIYNYSEDSYDDDYGGIPRQNAAVFTIGNYVYVTGGENGSIISTTWQYDPANDSWAQKTGFEGKERSGAVAFTLNNRGFVLTGRSGSLVMDDMYEFLPTDEQIDGD